MVSSHQLHETRSLQMHRIVAEHFLKEPVVVIRFALKNLERWRKQGVECEDFQVWKDLLAGPSQHVIDALTDGGEDAIRLRQSSPFAGLIPEETRRRILVSAE